MGGPPSIGAPKPSSTRPSRCGETFTSPFPPRRQDPIAKTEAAGLFERHGEDAAIAKPDHLGADGAAAAGADLAEVADGRGRPARFHDQPDQFDDLAFGTHRLHAVAGLRRNSSDQFRQLALIADQPPASRSARPRLISSSCVSTEASMMPSAE